ncbi:MAG TPA: LPXTG cell wall anchor domain-containing protein [Glycomyces sp.]|nr:LPXTG cell wall anchor domain-containing protein [Glycomyces sp.]
MHSSHPQRIGRRALAVLGTAALGVGAFALPAAAQTPRPVTAEVVFDEPVEAGADFTTGAMHLEFGDDFTPGEHEVFVQLSVYGNGWELADGETDDGACELAGTPPQWVNCTATAADAVLDFAFDYRAGAGMPSGEYDYALLIDIDGANLEPINGTVEVDGDDDDGSDQTFLYGKSQFEAEPGSATETAPGYLQQRSLPSGTAALVYRATEPGFLLSGTVEATAPYDNCIEEFKGSGPGVTCIVTDIEDLPGTVFAPSEPIVYKAADSAPGPIELCGCEFSVRALDAEALASEYGEVSWDAGSDDLFGLEVIDESGSPDHYDTVGYIDIRITENPYDLAVEEVNIKGGKGDRVKLTTPLKNLGPAAAVPFFDGPGSYALIGELPEGVELHAVHSDTGNVGELFCLDGEDWAHHLPDVDTDDLDFACFFQYLGAGDTLDFTISVDLVDPDPKDKGRLEVLALDNDGYPGIADANAKNNTADITVNGNGSGQLPKTGASLGMMIGAAALVLVAGAVLMVVTARRRKAAAEE